MLTTVTTATMSVSGCASLYPELSFCSGENAPLCIFLALAVGGLAIELLAGTGVVYHHVLLSDERLKTDVQYYRTLDNGLKVYGYRYKGDDRVFLGVMAKDLLKDRKFAHAVSKGKDGYYRVDYSKLGVKIANGDTMRQAGEAAARRAAR